MEKCPFKPIRFTKAEKKYLRSLNVKNIGLMPFETIQMVAENADSERSIRQLHKKSIGKSLDESITAKVIKYLSNPGDYSLYY